MDIQKLDIIPNSLLNIKSSPKELFFLGNMELLSKPKIAIVGTRRPSQYSKNFIYSLANKLSKNGFVVVSGGAIGTDILAHQSSFPDTISVMANSLDIIYPKTNSEMIRAMSKDALLISESRENVPAHPKKFIHRNRLIVGLADILIVIEADKKSGSSQTMRIAMEMGKKIYVLPHRIGESLETNSYLENGQAQGIYDIDNFIDNLKSLYGLDCKDDQGKMIQPEKKEFDSVLDFCKTSPTYEEAFAKFGDTLFEYELNGDIEVVNGFVILKN